MDLAAHESFALFLYFKFGERGVFNVGLFVCIYLLQFSYFLLLKQDSHFHFKAALNELKTSEFKNETLAEL